ncbi:lysylphosphatidylglycerol synthase transmembrane domain-containing protein [Parapedobacter tibetensis]|uniref:lysylphosphatidylglycerol synthase transmembrane domain-containing protein n=1 Tax=Parapedobacter tibetensis TaxID=2972951 RepID=UPI00214DB0BA|nr:lysylphosphatidylglycerol synthase transmembrane domain-containing protein [Parapedobacter tibetensis]
MNTKAYKIIFFTIGVGTLAYMLYTLGLNEIWLNIKKTREWFIPIIASWLVIYMMNALAFKAIIHEPRQPATHLPFFTVLRLTISGYAINYITPFVALGGEPYRIIELKPILGTAKASSSVVLYSLMHMFSHVVFWLLSILLILFVVPLSPLMVAFCVAMFVVGGLLCWWFSKVYRHGFTISLAALLGRVPLLGGKVQRFAAHKREMLEEIDEHIKQLYSQRRPTFYRSLLWEFGARMVGCAEIYFTAKALSLGMTMGEALIVSSASSLFANLVFFFPMQLGTREGGLALALKSIGMPMSAGIFIGIITRIREMVWIAIGLAMMGPSKKKGNPKPLTLELENGI